MKTAVIAGLVAGVLAGARPALAQAVAAAAPISPVDSTPASSKVPRRPFDHRFHERLACTQCHGSGAQHRTFLVRTPTDCARCHHDERLGKPCVECHAREGLPTNTRIGVSMTLTVRDTVVSRELPFSHDRHHELECRTCHGTPVTLDRNRQCSTCHDRHHRAGASCSSCHPRPAGALRDKHDVSAHLSCGASGCHAAGVAPSPALSRDLCLLCHPEKRAHEPGGACAACHQIPGRASIQRAAVLPGPENER